jgi:hypothetical protein
VAFFCTDVDETDASFIILHTMYLLIPSIFTGRSFRVFVQSKAGHQS